MLCYPKLGQRVQCWYAERKRGIAPLHGRIGMVVVASRGPGPRNHGVEIDGRFYVVPCGNLRKAADAGGEQ